MAKRLNIKEVIIAAENMSLNRKNEFVDKCLEADLQVMVVPPMSKWLNNELQPNQIRKIKIEELHKKIHSQ